VRRLELGRVADRDRGLRPKIWDAKSGADLLTLMGHTNRIHSVSWSPDGWQIVTGSEDTTAKIWDARPLQAKSPATR
jgi:WD40 repeat protein